MGLTDLLRRAASAALVPLLALALVPGAAAAQGMVVASGLLDPRFLAVTGDGTLYVTEAGTGGAERLPSPPDQHGPPATRGTTGQVTRVAPDGSKTVVVTGLPSYNEHGAVGPAGIVVTGGALWVNIGGGAVGANADGAHLQLLPNETSLVRIDPQTGAVAKVADLGAYEQAHNPDGNNVDSNPYGLAMGPDGNLYAVDAGGNVVYKVVPSSGALSVAQVVQPLPLPSGVQAPPGGNPELGGKPLLDSVPTSVAFGPDGAMYIGLLTGAPFPKGAARILRVGPDGMQRVYASGLTMVTAIAFGPDGLLYADEFSADFSPAMRGQAPAPGDVVRIRPDGSHQVVAANLMTVNGLAFNAAGDLYVGTNTVAMGPGAPGGQVLRFMGMAAAGKGTVAQVPAQTPAQVPAQMPNTGGGGAALTSDLALLGLLALGLGTTRLAGRRHQRAAPAGVPTGSIPRRDGWPPAQRWSREPAQ